MILLNNRSAFQTKLQRHTRWIQSCRIQSPYVLQQYPRFCEMGYFRFWTANRLIESISTEIVHVWGEICQRSLMMCCSASILHTPRLQTGANRKCASRNSENLLLTGRLWRKSSIDTRYFYCRIDTISKNKNYPTMLGTDYQSIVCIEES